MSTTITKTGWTVKVPDDLAARIAALQAVDDAGQFAIDAIAAEVRRRERGYAEGQRLLHGLGRPLDESAAAIRRATGGPDLSHLTRGELDEFGRQAIAALDPAVREKLFEPESVD